ncbi:hypothetical protein PR048_007219 [Dryococelus australis]|uniref:Uncharacterized protein n=1 Tax=Dryococelus australis TaxID=614101 RepID=A0ABQ9IDL0_9NEOP|nr:hypothetical protein PR048_007219 [Dryococelus australis]
MTSSGTLTDVAPETLHNQNFKGVATSLCTTINSELQCQTVSPDYVIIEFSELPPTMVANVKKYPRKQGDNGCSASMPCVGFEPRTSRTPDWLRTNRPRHGRLRDRLFSASMTPVLRGISYTSVNRFGQCRWSAGFLGDLPFPPPLHSGAAPYSPHFTLIGPQDLDLERASQKQSSDTHKTPYDRVKRCRERIIKTKASERVNQSGEPGLESLIGHPDLGLPWFSVTIPSEWCDGSCFSEQLALP